jgi:hypothetical protein
MTDYVNIYTEITLRVNKTYCSAIKQSNNYDGFEHMINKSINLKVVSEKLYLSDMFVVVVVCTGNCLNSVAYR